MSIIVKEHKNSIKTKESENGGIYTEEENKKDNNSAFNRLLNLQLLIQKHSGLKELCK
jgi:hypothetical protein